jgi:hypothetical protein
MTFFLSRFFNALLLGAVALTFAPFACAVGCFFAPFLTWLFDFALFAWRSGF